MKALLPLIALVALAACSPPSSQAAAKSDEMSSMQMETSSATTAQAGPIRSTGTVTQVDATAGTVTFSHGAIPAVNWPAMTMQFHAENPAILQGVAVGDHLTFELKSASEPQVITMIQRQ